MVAGVEGAEYREPSPQKGRLSMPAIVEPKDGPVSGLHRINLFKIYERKEERIVQFVDSSAF